MHYGPNIPKKCQNWYSVSNFPTINEGLSLNAAVGGARSKGAPTFTGAILAAICHLKDLELSTPNELIRYWMAIIAI